LSGAGPFVLDGRSVLSKGEPRNSRIKSQLTATTAATAPAEDASGSL
jgi:hypothetical protein